MVPTPQRRKLWSLHHGGATLVLCQAQTCRHTFCSIIACVSLKYRVEPGYTLTTTSCLCSTQYFVQANNWCTTISGTLVPKLLLCFLSRHTMRKWARRRCKVQTRRRRKSEQSCRQALLLVSDWSPQEEMVHSFIVPIYTSRPDLRQVQIYTSRSRFTAATDLHQSHGLCLQWHQAAPFWRHLYFFNFLSSL